MGDHYNGMPAVVKPLEQPHDPRRRYWNRAPLSVHRPAAASPAHRCPGSCTARISRLTPPIPIGAQAGQLLPPAAVRRKIPAGCGGFVSPCRAEPAAPVQQAGFRSGNLVTPENPYAASSERAGRTSRCELPHNGRGIMTLLQNSTGGDQPAQDSRCRTGNFRPAPMPPLFSFPVPCRKAAPRKAVQTRSSSPRPPRCPPQREDSAR